MAQSSLRSSSGIWLGTLAVGSLKLRVQFHLDAGTGACSMDSLDQGAVGIGCTELEVDAAQVSFAVPSIRGRFQGTLGADNNTLEGTWTQGLSLPLTLTRQTEAAPVVTPKLDPAMPPLEHDELQEVLDRDLREMAESGWFSPGQGGGVTIGVVQRGKRSVLAYGQGRLHGLYEIGSVTKTFTGLMLAQMVEQQQVTYHTPVRELLPPGTVGRPDSEREITLLDLSRHYSGLPRMPDNFRPADPKNPYADYTPELLYAFLANHGVAVAPGADYLYSNLGAGLLGQALANRASTSYPSLLQRLVTGPLGMRETVTSIPREFRNRVMQGYNAGREPSPAWDLDALAGAGAIRSTANDMLTYLQAQLHPEQLPATANATAQGRTLPSAIAASHVLQGEAGPRIQVGLGWLYSEEGSVFWHSGATGSFSSYASFHPQLDYAVVVLCNTAYSGLSDKLGVHVAQRLEGKPALAIEAVV